MSKVLDGIGASEGIGAGRVHILNWGVPEVPRRSIDADEVEGEVEHLLEVFEWAKTRILVIEDSTEERLGAVEARIFEPQLLMLEDPELIEGAARYIRENRLSAARALDWRLLEIQAKWSRTAHP
ncbi:MAG: phosphoenolpyruvate-utilizing N-terminal domain-containing protein, partial [Gemmatimonadota bacterium]|nr:phosphoenolpyruvate-utilizing N-terminal domain-containing protein [Gemmatimonadota bacterium]